MMHSRFVSHFRCPPRVRLRPLAKRSVLPLLIAAVVFLIPAIAIAAEDGEILPALSITFGGSGESEGLAPAIQIVLLLTVLTLVPSILVMMTSFTRLVIVFALLRQAIGVQQAPPNQVLIGMALFLTFFVMHPAFKSINANAIQPYREGLLTQETALAEAATPLKEFMLKNVRKKDLKLFVDITKAERPASKEDVPLYVLIPAFVTSELKTAFQIGFLIYLPFLVIDMVVASVLMSMGMMMLPPVMISLPFKLMLFVLADGWYLLVGSLVNSFG